MSEESKATNSLTRLTKWFGSVMCVLIATGVIGVVVMAREQSAMTATVAEIGNRLDRWETRWENRWSQIDDRLRKVESSPRVMQ